MRHFTTAFLQRRIRHIAMGAGLIICQASSAAAQDRLPTMPGYDHYSRMSQQIRDAAQPIFRSSLGSVVWLPDGSGMEYALNGKFYHYEFANRKKTEIDKLSSQPAFPGRPGRGALERGRQAASAESPDHKYKAFYKDANLWLSSADGSNPMAITTEGSLAKRIKYGTGSWVYGEELSQTTAFWWSPDSHWIAFYRFDESQVKDYYVTMRTLDTQDVVDTEPYPKAGAPNPVVDLFVYNLDTKQTTHADVRDGKPFENETVGYYVYNVRWSPDGRELLFNRANRKQNIVEFAACDPASGKCRTIAREAWSASWAEDHPNIVFLKDRQRFILTSERSGYHNLYLYNLAGQQLATLTQLKAEVESILQVNEAAGTLFYMARDGDNPMKQQLHRVGLDGKNEVRLTDPAFNHRIQVAPDGKHFVDRAETHSAPPTTRLLDEGGKILDTLTAADVSKLDALHVSPPELFSFKAADGQTDCYGLLHKPSNFDPARKYPLLVSIYAGPESSAVNENYMGSSFGTPDTLTEMGFLVAQFDGRGSNGRGKKFRDAVYGKLGTVEIDDQAEGVKYLRQRPYVDGSRVGIHGVSYGGYASAMCLLRYPDVFQAACAQSSVTDWRNYDTIYTERFMGLPQENKAGYDAGSAMTYAANLHGRLMLYFGTADNNVHPANTYQLVQALQRAGKSFDLQIGPDQGHTGLNRARMLEFFMDALVLKPATSGS